MRDIDEGYLHLLLYSLELYLHLLAQLQVERAERLVEKEHLRVVDKSACDRDSLLLTAGELVHSALVKALEVDHLEHLTDTP